MTENEKVEEKSEGVTEQKHITEVKVDMSGMQAIADLKEQNNAMQKQMEILLGKLDAMKQVSPVVPEVKEDKTKGIVKEEVKTEKRIEDGIVVEKADSGKGFQIWRDYSKENCRFKRLAR